MMFCFDIVILGITLLVYVILGLDPSIFLPSVILGLDPSIHMSNVLFE